MQKREKSPTLIPFFCFQATKNITSQISIHHSNSKPSQSLHLKFPTQTQPESNMTTLQKFKLLATQCGVTQSPTRSPRTSPLLNFRRPKTTLRMLLTRSGSRKSSSCREMAYPQSLFGISGEKKKGDKDLSGRTLKDLFVSSGGYEEEQGKVVEEKFGGKGEVELARKLGGVSGLGGEAGSPRAGWMGFRHRMLLRKAWRPMLQTIHE